MNDKWSLRHETVIAGENTKDQICLPEKWSMNQLILIFNKYVKNNPELLTKNAAGTVTLSLVNAFPCK